MSTLAYSTGKPRRARRRGFTLVELMVAITGGLFVSIIVFTLAKHSANFYQSEQRIGEATLGGMVGFERLRNDIARASFLSSPNLIKDPRVCGKPPEIAGFPALLENLTNVVITRNATSSTSRTQDTILLTGSYSSIDSFSMAAFSRTGNGAGPSLFLNENSLAMERLGYDPSASPAAKSAALTALFRTARAVRIVDRTGRHYYSVISGVNTNAAGAPEIMLRAAPAIILPGFGNFCSLDNCEGCSVNVVNFIRYDVARVASADYAPLYADGGVAAPFDDTRTELRRVELDVDGNVIAGTEELVAQYAVDLKFGLLVERVTGGVPGLSTIDFDDDEIDSFAGPPDTAHPELIRGVRVRFAVRSRDADREVDIDPASLGLPDGLYRIGLGPNGTAPFARVRTFQADVVLNNMSSAMGITWPP